MKSYFMKATTVQDPGFSVEVNTNSTGMFTLLLSASTGHEIRACYFLLYRHTNSPKDCYEVNSPHHAKQTGVVVR